MRKCNTHWTCATKDPQIAMDSLIHCLRSGYNAWIESRKNGDQCFPIMIPNPVLNDPFNWKFSHTTHRNDNEIAKYDFLNDTERDLTVNWVNAMGTKEAVEAYKKDRTLMKGLMLGGSIGCPVRIEDANRYRATIMGDNYRYAYFADWWTPVDGIDRYVPDPDIGRVFTICHNDEPFDIKQSCRNAAQFLLDYAETF